VSGWKQAGNDTFYILGGAKSTAGDPVGYVLAKSDDQR
jgi:hypothetical protein